MRKQLRMSYDIDKITELENDKKLKSKKYNKLLKENDNLKKTRSKHLKEINEYDQEGNWSERKDILVNELRECKAQARAEYYVNLERKKTLINKHEDVVLLDKKIRKMQKLIDAKKKSLPPTTDEENTPGSDKIDDLNEKVKEATKVMEFEEKRAEIELHKQESDISKMQHELEIAALKLREKDQEFRLCELKIKELKRQTRHNALKPLDFDLGNAQVKTTGHKSYRDYQIEYIHGKSESSNLQSTLGRQPMELTEENMKLYEKSLRNQERDEDYEFYSNFDDQNSQEEVSKAKKKASPRK